jgi:hypothetical protein
MLSQQLKNRVEAGTYKPDPARIAGAMLRRRAVRELLIEGPTLRPVGRSPSQAEPRRQAA